MSCASSRDQHLWAIDFKDLWENLEGDAIFPKKLSQHPPGRMRTRDRIYDNIFEELPSDINNFSLQLKPHSLKIKQSEEEDRELFCSML